YRFLSTLFSSTPFFRSKASFSRPNLDQDVLAVWVVFWGLYRHSREIQRVHQETYHGYVELLRGLLGELAPGPGRPRFNLRLAAKIGKHTSELQSHLNLV